MAMTAACPVASAQSCGGQLSGQVLDPDHAEIPGAAVSLPVPGAGVVKATTDGAGRFSFPCVADGTYTVHVDAAGFNSVDVEEHAAAHAAPLVVVLSIAVVKTEVVAGEDPTSLDTSHGAGTHTLNQADIQQLADDPDDFARQLQVLAATSGGAPGQAIITVDGFQNGATLPPKSSIASIRINPDLFSSEYAEPPYRGGRIEVFTKPGLDTFHGALFFTDSDSSFNANDPFAVTATPAGKRRYGFELSGPVAPRKADFSLALEKRDIDEYNVVDAVVPGADGAGVPFSQSVAAPQRLWIASSRMDLAVSANDNATLSYTAHRSELANQGVGGLSLLEAGYGSTVGEYDLRLANMQTISPNVLHDTHIGFTWNDTQDSPNSTAPGLNVEGYFTGGGSVLQGYRDRERDLEIDEDLLVTRGAHTVKLGAQALGIFIHANDPNTFNGAYTFGGTEIGGTEVSALEQYSRALAGVAGGAPTTYEQTTGNTLVPFTQWRLALYAQDSWKLASRLQVSGGVRYTLETSPNTYANFAPRVAMAWSPDKKSKWVIHLRAGLFASVVPQATTLDIYRLNGTRQNETLVYDPSYTSPLTPVAGSLAVSTVNRFAPHMIQSPSFQSQEGVERDLPHHWHVQANLYNVLGWDDIRTRNINAPLVNASTVNPLLAPRPGPANLNVFETQGSGNIHGNVEFVGVDQHSYKRFGFFVGYLHFNLVTDTDAAPQNSYSDHGEMVRPSWQNAQRVFVIGQLNLPWKVEAAPQLDAASGAPYNVTQGTDTNGDGDFNDRPSYAGAQTGPGVYPTQFGNLVAAVNGSLPRNIGTMPATVHLDMNLSRSFALNGTGSKHHQAIAINARAANLLNHTNVTAVGTVLGSPTLGAPLAAEPARRLELGCRWSF